MSQRDGYQPGVPCWVAAVLPDPNGAVGFYTELFGWEAANLMPSDSPGAYYMCTLRGRPVAAIVSQHGAPPPPRPAWTTHVWMGSADEAAGRVVEAGGSRLGEPFDSPAGGRQAVLADPSGAAFCAWQPGTHRGAQLVNEPGAWSMSFLNTRDPDEAKSFYSAVFGWETDTFDTGGSQITLWRVPGYVGGEPDQPVARDVVAAMAPMSADRFPADAPAHWSVDFWVADAEGAAQAAGRLGGAVIAGPYEVPGFHQAVLADPQGATFTVSQRIAGP
jgi:predicted enzyme related to lactoylglutathione lyase